MNRNIKLTVKEINTKAAKFHYKVVDTDTNEVITQRKSNRVYIAATFNGAMYTSVMNGISAMYRNGYSDSQIAYLDGPHPGK